MIILSGDIGGTNTRLQLTRFSNTAPPDIILTERYKNADHTHLTSIIQQFLADIDLSDIHSAAFAIAGPIVDGEVKLTNLPWQLSEVQLLQTLDLPKIHFLNDFEAMGYGILTLQADALHTLQTGKPDETRMKAIIGAGTGLGVALVNAVGEGHTVTPTEGGHMDFAPTDDDQQGLFDMLRHKLHRVSNERIVSGMGLVNIYKYVRSKAEFDGMEHPELKRLLMYSTEFGADITHYAFEERDPICLQTLDIFVRCYGAVAGNLALTTLPYGGLYITGGIAPNLLPLMQDGRFMQAFADKGRLSSLLHDIPVHIVLNTHIGLTGAAYYAAHY